MVIENELTGAIIGAAIEVHRHLELPVLSKGKKLNVGYRIDLLINQLVIVELKSVQHLEKIHETQLLTYLKMAKKRFGLLLNFNVPVMKQGIRRLLNDWS